MLNRILQALKTGVVEAREDYRRMVDEVKRAKAENELAAINRRDAERCVRRLLSH